MGRSGIFDSCCDTGFVAGLEWSQAPSISEKGNFSSQREVNNVLGKEKGPGTQSKIRISDSRE